MNDLSDWNQLEQFLRESSGETRLEVHEDGEWLAELSSPHCELRREGKHPIVHLWSGERNLTRRVLRVLESSPHHAVLEIQRFGRAKPGRLDLRHADAPRPAGRVAREKFRARFRRLLEQSFPDGRCENLTSAPNLERTFSGLYTRGVLAEGGRAWAVLGIGPDEDSAAVEGSLTFGLLWLDWLRSHSRRRAIAGLRIFAPRGSGLLLRHRFQALHPSAGAELYEFSESDASIRRVGISDHGNMESWLIPRSEMEKKLAASCEALAAIRRLAPEGMPIESAVSADAREVLLRCHGFSFGRWRDGKTWFGLGEEWRELTAASQSDLVKILAELYTHRSAASGGAGHPLYRAAPEKWLEEKISADPESLDAALDPRFFYPQVPTLRAPASRGVMDLLGKTRQGRLVVIELKASEDPQLPLQAVDYWLRVRWHQREGDFARYGYFPGVELDPRPPLLWLVAPGLRFHPAVEIILKYLSPEIQTTRIGLNESWRRTLQVVFRQ